MALGQSGTPRGKARFRSIGKAMLMIIALLAGYCALESRSPAPPHSLSALATPRSGMPSLLPGYPG